MTFAGETGDQHLRRDLGSADHQRVGGDEAAGPDDRAVEDRAVVGDQGFGADMRAVDGAHVRDGGPWADVDRDSRRSVQNRAVLDVGAFPDHHRA